MTAARFRTLALDLPDAVEGAHHGHADFRVAGRIFASLGPGERWAMVKVLPVQQRALVRDRPAAFEPFDGAWGRGGATKVVLSACRVPDARKALRAAWEHVATAPARATKRRSRAPANSRPRGGSRRSD